ncbi:hypothetical protein [Nannocystis pusilla]|uniref:hypothetical protein n=1 Tax=Nannocystis pusilla TaxID=889268 RepID=UPI003B7DFFDF
MKTTIMMPMVAGRRRPDKGSSGSLSSCLAAGASLAAGLAVLLARPRAHSRARLRAGGAALVYQF